MSEAKKESMGMLVVVLFLITFITALLLGFVNQVTAPQIEKNNEATRAAAMAELIPEAEPVQAEPAEVPSPDKDTPAIQNIYEMQKDGETVGYCMEVLPSGFGGTLTVVVGINTDGTVAGAKVTSHAETPGPRRKGAGRTRPGSRSSQASPRTARWPLPRTAATSSRSPARPSPPVRSQRRSIRRLPTSSPWHLK